MLLFSYYHLYNSLVYKIPSFWVILWAGARQQLHTLACRPDCCRDITPCMFIFGTLGTVTGNISVGSHCCAFLLAKVGGNTNLNVCPSTKMQVEWMQSWLVNKDSSSTWTSLDVLWVNCGCQWWYCHHCSLGTIPNSTGVLNCGGSFVCVSGRRVDRGAALKARPKVPHLARDDRNMERCLV